MGRQGWRQRITALMGAVSGEGRVFPDMDAVPGTGGLKAVVGALLTVVLVTAVLMLVVSAAGWAVAASRGDVQASMRARMGVWVSVTTAAAAGAGQAWLGFLIDTGAGL